MHVHLRRSGGVSAHTGDISVRVQHHELVTVTM